MPSSKVQPKEFKESVQRLQWQESAINEINSLYASSDCNLPITAWFPPCVAYLAPLPAVAPAALAKLLSVCINEEDKTVIDKTYCQQLHSLIMTKCASLITKPTPDISLRLPHYMNALIKMVECNALEMKMICNDFLALKSIKGKQGSGFEIALSTFIKGCISYYRWNPTTANSHELFAVLEKLVANDKSFIDCIWLEVRLILERPSSDKSSTFDEDFAIFFLDKLLPKAPKTDARTGYRLAEVIELLMERQCHIEFLQRVIDIGNFRMIEDQPGLETTVKRLLSVLEQVPYLRRRLSLIAIEVFALTAESRLKYQIDFYQDLLLQDATSRSTPMSALHEEDTLSPQVQASRVSDVPGSKGTSLIISLAFLRIIEACVKTTNADSDLRLMLDLLNEISVTYLLQQESSPIPPRFRWFLTALIIAFIYQMMSKVQTGKSRALLTNLMEKLQQVYTPMEHRRLSEDDADDDKVLMRVFYEEMTEDQALRMHWITSTLIVIDYSVEYSTSSRTPSLHSGLELLTGAPFNPLLMLCLSTILISQPTNGSDEMVLILYRHWAAAKPLCRSQEALGVSPAIYSLVDHLPVLFSLVERGDYSALICIASLARHRHLAPVIFSYVRQCSATFAQSSVNVIFCRLFLQESLPYSKLEGAVFAAKGASLQLLSDALHVDYLQVAQTLQTKLWPLLIQGALSPHEEDVCIGLLQQLGWMGVIGLYEVWLWVKDGAATVFNLPRRSEQGIHSLVSLLLDFVIVGVVPHIVNRSIDEEPEDELSKHFQSLMPWLHDMLSILWAEEKTRNHVMIILAPILEHSHKFDLNDLATSSLASEATLFQDHPSCEFLDAKFEFAMMEKPAGFLSLLKSGKIRLQTTSKLQPLLEGLLSVHRLAIGQRIRKTGTVNHPMVGLTSRALHPKFAPGCSKELLAEAECALYNPPAMSAAEDSSGGPSAQDKFKALLIRAVFQTSSSVPVTLTGSTQKGPTVAAWEAKMYMWHQCLQHQWRLLFIRYLNSFSMTAKNEEAWKIYEFLTDFLDEENKQLSLETDLSSFLKLILAFSGLGLGHPELGHNVANALMLTIEKQGLQQIRKDPTNLCWLLGCILTCLSVMHSELKIPNLLNYSLSLLLKVFDRMEFPIRRQILNLSGVEISYDVLKVTDFTNLTDIPRNVVIVGILMVMLSECGLRFTTDRSMALQIRTLLREFAAAHNLTNAALSLLAFLDASLLQSVSEDSIVPHICDLTKPETIDNFQMATALPRLFQMNGVSVAEVEHILATRFNVVTDHGTWKHWLRCLVLNGLKAAGFTTPEFEEGYQTQIVMCLTTPLNGHASEAQMFVALEAAHNLLGVQTILPSIISYSGDFKNHLKQSVQTFFDLVKLPFMKTKEPIGKALINWLGTAQQQVHIAGKSLSTQSESRVTLGNMTPASLPFLALVHQTLRSYKDPTLTLDALPNNCLVKHCLQRLRNFGDMSLEELRDLLFQFTQVSSLPDLNLRILIAPILSKMMKDYLQQNGSGASTPRSPTIVQQSDSGQSTASPNETTDKKLLMESVIINLWEFSIAHAPKDSSLASLLSDFAVIYWVKKLSLRLRFQFVRIAVIPLSLILSPVEWIKFVQRIAQFDDKPKVFSCLLIRQLTALAVLARHVQERPDSEAALVEKETSMRSLVPVAWHQSFRRHIAAVALASDPSQTCRVEAKSEMIYFSTLARRCLEEVYDRLMDTVILKLCLMEDPAMCEIDSMCTGAAALFITQYLRIKQDLPSSSLVELPILMQGYSFLAGQLSSIHWTLVQQKLIGYEDQYESKVWLTRAWVFVQCSLKKGRTCCIKMLEHVLLSSTMTQEVHTEKALIVSMFFIYALAAPYFYFLQGGWSSVLVKEQADGAAEGARKNRSNLEMAEKPMPLLETQRWDYLFHSRSGVDLLVTSTTRSGLRIARDNLVTTAVEKCPLLYDNIWELLESIFHPLGDEPVDTAIASAAAGQVREAQFKKLALQLRTETLEDRCFDTVVNAEDYPSDVQIPMQVSMSAIKNATVFLSLVVESSHGDGPASSGTDAPNLHECLLRYRTLIRDIEFASDERQLEFIKLL